MSPTPCTFLCKAVWIPSPSRRNWGRGEAQLSQVLLTQCLRADTFSPGSCLELQTGQNAAYGRLSRPVILGHSPKWTLLWSLLSAVISHCSVLVCGSSSYCASGTLFWGQPISLLRAFLEKSSDMISLLSHTAQPFPVLAPIHSVASYSRRKLKVSGVRSLTSHSPTYKLTCTCTHPSHLFSMKELPHPQ